MNWKRSEKLVAWGVFLYALVVYLLTVAPATSFWDSGEFIAIANRLQVSHPPGAPFFMLVGRLFSMFVPTEYVAFSVNLISVLSSALTILFLHLIIVRLVREWQGPESSRTTEDRISALVGGAIGATTFAVTDSFWFNAVEAEVYAMSMLFTAAVIWLILKWREQVAELDIQVKGIRSFGLSTNRYLILIAYLFGLAIGIHLLNLLAIFFIALIVYFVEFDDPDASTGKRVGGLIMTGAISSLAFLVVYPGIVQWLPGAIGESSAPVLLLLAFFAVLAGAVYFTHRNHMRVFNLIALCVTMVLIGYSTYALIFIRSASNPPIDENDPENIEGIVSYLRREQYGQTPILKGSTFDNRTGQINQRKEVFFPRRYSPDPNHIRTYRAYKSDSEFFWKYQLGHMYIRYFLWNFVGKASDVQDAAAITGLSDKESAQYLYQTPSERASRNAYYGLPLLLGLIGAAFHFLRDWRRAFAVLMLFLVTGIGIIIYLNQTPMQPRERDYSYVASFFAFSIWIGIGATGVLQLTSDALRERIRTSRTIQSLLIALSVIIFAAVPLLMMLVNFSDHDRSGRYVAGDYAYNMLMSLDDNAIVFTNGDNDTFPLWYIQEVERVRTDVRVANLSLLNTPWYVRQLKYQSSRESAPLPITMSDEQIDKLTIVRWRPREIELPVNRKKLLTSDSGAIQLEDSSHLESPMRWKLEGRPYQLDQNISLLYGADQAALNMIITNAQQDWKRPIYFAVTVSPDGQLDLQDYFQLEGQAYRIVPIKTDEPLGRVVPEITAERLKKFRFRGLNDPDVYFDENIRRMVDNYRNIFSHTAESMAQAGMKEEARELLDDFMVKVPFETIPGDERSFFFMADAYRALGDREKAVSLLKKAEPLVLHRIENPRSSRDLDRAAQFLEIIRNAYLEARDFEAASAFTDRIAALLQDSSYRQTPEEMQAMYDTALERRRADSVRN
jgi:tetratricopeptide (TPR) repeat protein